MVQDLLTNRARKVHPLVLKNGLYSRFELATLVGTTESTFGGWIRQGKLPEGIKLARRVTGYDFDTCLLIFDLLRNKGIADTREAKKLFLAHPSFDPEFRSQQRELLNQGERKEEQGETGEIVGEYLVSFRSIVESLSLNLDYAYRLRRKARNIPTPQSRCPLLYRAEDVSAVKTALLKEYKKTQQTTKIKQPRSRNGKFSVALQIQTKKSPAVDTFEYNHRFLDQLYKMTESIQKDVEDLKSSLEPYKELETSLHNHLNTIEEKLDSVRGRHSWWSGRRG